MVDTAATSGRVVLTGPSAALEEVDGSAAQVSVRELHGDPGEPEQDQGDQQQAELFQQAVGGRGRGRRGRRDRRVGRHGGELVAAVLCSGNGETVGSRGVRSPGRVGRKRRTADLEKKNKQEITTTNEKYGNSKKKKRVTKPTAERVVGSKRSLSQN